MISRNRLLAISAMSLIIAGVAPAAAGECPADQVMAGANATGETMPKGVTDTVLSAVDLSAKGDAFAGYMLRLRRLVIEPGGVVPWHSHAERAANITIVEGEIEEHSSNCKVAILHKAGDTVGEFGPELSHWWMNKSDKPVVIISGDLLPPEMKKVEMME
jgi:quercetin dioxygenase-like cupin family protein